MITEEPEYALTIGFLDSDEAMQLFDTLSREVNWDTSMKARKTACYGETYDESGVEYEVQPMIESLSALCDKVNQALLFRPTNCLLNFYEDGKSTMGFHSDTISNLDDDTGIVIISLGGEREITFRNIEDYDKRHTYLLPHGSLFYMTQETQKYWTHAVKKSPVNDARISITFRRILSSRKGQVV